MLNLTFQGKRISAQMIKEEKWLGFLTLTRERIINPERVNSVEEMNDNQVLSYVERTLNCPSIETIEDELCRDYVIRTLQWSEVSKGGTVLDRARWEAQGLSLEIHNEASAEIYLQECSDAEEMKRIVYPLIKTHGLFGQYLRGEILFSETDPLKELHQFLTPEQLKQILEVLNEAVISAVSVQLWEQVKSEILYLIKCLCEKEDVPEEPVLVRLRKLFPNIFAEVNALTEEENILYKDMFSKHDFWYPESALSTFTRNEIFEIFSMIYKEDRTNIRHVSFYGMSRGLHYDYEGKKKINIYKKRIIEFCLRELRENICDTKVSEHIQFICEKKGDTLFFDVQFTRVCDSLISFCVEAERSGIMDYQKNITTIFDLFGFRRDIFDRLNNEEKYLQTMNDTQLSRKSEILDFISGETIVDVGSGGGVLLDLLEKQFPDKTIIGTDISANVIETLNKKIIEEKHHYQVLRHNFVEGPLTEKADTIIFSSILHEVYSYTEYKGKKFQIDAVKTALKNARASLKEGGRIVIRDGVLSDGAERFSIKMKDQDGVKFLGNYMKDFKGLTDLRNADDEWNPEYVSFDGLMTLHADINFIREFLYTYTWGIESYSCEVNEQFGYFTLEEYAAFMKSMGMKVITAEAYLEPGYPENLDKLVELQDGLTWQMMPSNCILAAECE